MKFEVVIEPEAEDGIAEAFRYIWQASPANAERWLRGVYQQIDRLEMFPNGYGLAREAEAFGRDIRQVVFKSHRIIFEVRGQKVHVLHVRHAARLPLDPPPPP